MQITYKGYIIDTSRIRGTQGKTQCPMCKELGKKHWRDPCLSINLTSKLLKCHKCGFSGYFGERRNHTEKMEYKKADIGNTTELSNEHLQYFSRRGITQKTLNRNEIRSNKEWIAFPYCEGDEVVNIKYRHSKEKKFMQTKGGKPTMYKYNDAIGQKIIIICEGEIDTLSWEEAGYLFAISVNQGAPNANDRNIDKKLQCVRNCFDILEEADVIYLSVDKDENGIRLQKELIKMLTPEKCKIIDHGDCKDANEMLLKHGKQALVDAFNNAKDVKMEGIFECSECFDSILESYQNGQPRGSTTHYEEIDPCFTWRPGEVNVFSGYNNEGKSKLLKLLLLAKSIAEGWKHAFFSPEDVPLSEWYTDLIESYVGKSADKTQKKYDNYMNEMQLKDGMKFMDAHFYNVYPNEDHSVDELLRRFSYLVRKYGIQTVTIDPYNQIHHKMNPGEREDLYISRFMAKLKKFAVDHNVIVNLVAHQNTPLVQKGENYPEPNLYRIKGGGTFADKADNVLVVWREHRNTDPKNTAVKFISQKIKKQKLTGIPGCAELQFDRRTNGYLGRHGSPIETLKKPPEQVGLQGLYEENDIYDPKNVLNDDEVPF